MGVWLEEPSIRCLEALGSGEGAFPLSITGRKKGVTLASPKHLGISKKTPGDRRARLFGSFLQVGRDFPVGGTGGAGGKQT